ncbi:type II toxin-antitoxin system RelE/ParE family toxin [Labrys neptuniae]
MKVVYAPRALRDLEAVAAYVGDRSASGAKHVLAAIKTSIETLSLFPKIGRVVTPKGHRFIPVLKYPYVIFYRVEGDTLLVLHIRHAARRPIDPETGL